MPEEKKTDYLEMAKTIYNAAETYHTEMDKAKIQAALTMATIIIAEELRRLNENLESEGERSFIQALWNIAPN